MEKLTWNTFIDRYPAPIWDSVDDTEIHPVSDRDGIIEECDEEDADYYSVYVHLTTGGLSCIADCRDKETAERLSELIKQIILKAKP